MRRFSTSITKILEAVDLDMIDDTKDLKIKSDKYFVAQVVIAYKKGELEQKRASALLVDRATEMKENKPLAIAADFIDILNQSTKTSGVINTSTLRKIAQNLNVIEGALDKLEPEDQVIALKLIESGIKQREKKTSTPSLGRGRKIGRE